MKNPSPYIGHHCHYKGGNMDHVCSLEEHGEHQVELIGMGFAEPYRVAVFGNCIMQELVTDGSIRIIKAD